MKKKESGRVRARVVWDEGNLEEIEANKPVRQKITEPKTPYHVPKYEDDFIGVSDEEKTLDTVAHAEAIRTALSKVESSSSEWSRQGDWTSSGDEAEDMEQDEVVHSENGNKPSFEDLRRLHYDEYQKVKQLRQQHSVENEDVEVNGKERS
uniref:Protein phosphatase inhibitor 2 n=1 Tax=Araucaria cunninghamii TaxID=56994 RepID=A0A0D6R8K7_ARACU